jgi:two-component system chemotaxis response regulator CheY
MAAKILIVDDSTMVRRQAAALLAAAGYATYEAVDGADACTKVQPETTLILCDVNMPRMNGLELLDQLSREPETARIPVVMLTTEGQPDLIQRAKALGAKYWMIKPLKAELLLAVVKKLVP